MRQRIGRRLISIMLSVLMLVSLLPTAVFAEELPDQTTAGVTEQVGEGTGNTVKNSTENEDSIGTTVTTNEALAAAIAAAKDGDTITLGKGEFTTYGKTSPQKSLTFVGAGAGTVWTIGDLTKDVGGEGNGDYSFDGCDTITFRNMTLKSDGADYRGFIRISNTVVDNCTINGKTAYWGYETAKFQSGTEFNAPDGDYALWDYSTKAMTFNGCTFNISGKGVNVYVEAGNAGSAAREVTVNDCTVNSTRESKAFLNIKNSTQAYDVTISGNNTVTGLGVNSTTNSALYQVQTTEITETSGKSVKVQEKKADGTLTTIYEVKAPVVDYIDLDTFIKWLENSSYSVDGANYTNNKDAVVGGKLVVKWSPVSGCYDTREGHECTVGNVAATGNTPKRVNNGLTQFQLFEGENVNVAVKNVKFVYERAAFTVCENSGWKGSFAAADAPAGQLYFMTTGDVTFDSCEFDKVVLTSFNTTGSSTVTNCKFANVYNNYAIKDIRGANVSVTGTTITNCGGGIMVSSTGDVEKVTISGNTFKDVDVAGTAAEDKVGSRGLIQVANSGTYTNTNYDFSGNSATNCGPVLRQLNESVKLDKANTEKLKELGELYTSDSLQVASVGGVVYPTLKAAFAALSAENHTLTLIKADAWAESTPVYWVAGTQSGYVAKLTDALTAAYKANAGDITIVCCPGADVGTMTHGHVADNITIYGNDAYISGGECDLEVDTYMFSRDTGKQVESGGVYLDKNITINAYELDNLGVWGERHTTYEVNVNLTDCDGKAFDGVKNLQRVYISGTTGVNNITLKGCDFLTAATAVYSNANGKIVVDGCSFTGTAIPVNINHKAGGDVTVEVKNSTFTGCGSVKSGEKQYAAPIRFVNSGSGTMQATVDSCTITGTKGTNGDILIGDGRTGQASNDLSLKVTETTGQVQVQKPGYWITNNRKDPANETHFDVASTATFETSIKKAFITATTGTETDPYTLEQFNEMTRAEYIAAQDRLGGTMYVTVGEYAYATQGVLGNGTADNSDKDSTKLNYYGAPGAKEGQYSDAAVGKSVVFVGDSIENAVEGYTDIDRIGTSLLLAVPAYTNVTFKGIDFYGVFSFNYQLYTSPWSQLGSLNFEGCTFNGLIVGAIAAQTLKFEGCTFNEYSNSASTNNSNPIWVRPAYGNWTKDDNEGQGENFKSLTTIAFTGNTVNSTRPVKFERIAQWEMDTKVTATDNTFNIRNDGSGAKNVGMYFGANAKFDLVVDNNKASSKTAGLYTAVYSAPNGTNYPGLPAGSTVKDASGNNIEKGVPALVWKSTKPLTLKTTEEVAQLTTTKGVVVKFATLEEAIAEAKDGDTVKLLKSCSGNGIKIETKNFANAGLTVDFGGCTYAVGGVLVGSAGTGTNAFQLLKGGKVTFRNGTIVGVTEGTKPAEDTPNWHGAPAIVIQNYCDLTLKDMTVSGGDETIYTVSNNHGNVVIEDSIINAGNAKGSGYGPFAFDVCGYSTYDGVSVTVKGNSSINGDIEVSRSANNTKDVKLALESGAINGKLKIDSTIKDITTTTTVTKGSDVTVAAPVGYAWNAEGTLVAAVAQIGENGYVTLADAIAAAEDGNTVQLLKDVTDEDVTISKSITLDLGGKTLTNTNSGKATISVKNGVFATVKNGSVVGGTSFYNIQVGEAVNSTANLTLMNVTATAGNNDSSMIDNWGTLTIVSGTYTGGLNVVKSEEGSTLTINGGTFTLEYATNGYTGVVFAYGDTTISGGEFIQSLTTTGRWNHPTVILTGVVEGYTAITRVTGGHFVNKMSGESIFRGVGKATSDNFEVSGGTFNKSISDGYCADGFIPTKNADGTYGVKAGKYVAEVKGTKYETLQAAINAAGRNATVTMLADTRENVTINNAMTLDLNGYTLNGGTVKGTPTLKIDTARVTVMDSSEAQTGTIMREDTAENSGVSSHYVIDIQGKNALLTFNSGNVRNNSGNAEGKGASLVRVGNDSDKKAHSVLTIAGGTFTQDNFIVIKVDFGTLHLKGGTVNSKTSYAVENWLNANIKGVAVVNGAVSSWTYSSGSNSTLTISGGTVNGDVTSVNYGNAEGKKATVAITGGTINGELDTRSYDPKTNKLTSISDATKATIEVTAGTFAKDPTKYVVEDSTVNKNTDGTFGVEKAYLAKVGNTSYYTMDEAFKAQTASGEPIVMLRDYTTGSPFSSGSINRTVDLNGHTWTCTGTDTNSAAFEINYSNVTLTVKNGKVVSSQLVGLIPSVRGGAITYDNSSLVFDGVEMSTTACSGIETNGNNTNDTVTLKNSTLNVPNGFGIYFPSSGTLTIENSTINAKTMGVQVCAGSLSINDGSAITVTGNAVPKTENDGAIQDGAAISIVNRTGYKGLETVKINEGTFVAKAGNQAIKAYDWANKVVSEFTQGEKVTIAEEKVLSSSANTGVTPTAGTAWVLVPGEKVLYAIRKISDCEAEINGTYYLKLQDAIDAANSGDTVELVKDVDLTQTVVVNKTITLDMNGKKLHNTNGIWNDANRDWSLISVRSGDLTITGNGTLDALRDDCYAVDVRDNGKLTIENGKFVGNISAVYNRGGEVTIKDGDFSIKQLNSNNVQDGYGLLINCYDESYKNGEATITITGGTFQNFDPMNNQAEGVGTSFVAAGVGVDHVDGKFTAKSGMTAQVVDEDSKSVKAFEDLADALDAAAKIDGNVTVKMLNDVTSGVKYVDIESNVTLDLCGHSIMGARALWSSGDVIDSAANKGVVSAARYSLDKGNAYTPIYNKAKAGFSFFNLQLRTRLVPTDGTDVKTVEFKLDNSEAHVAERNRAFALLKDGFASSYVKARVVVSWTAKDSEQEQRFVFNDNFMALYCNTEAAQKFIVTFTGLNGIEADQVTARAEFVTYDSNGNEMCILKATELTLK